ncbi:MAG: chemotaxis protein CheC [Fimbriimonadaceae bacterium]|nr:chemotaxis protein CheC [Fimbriimonadaceae bacterium]QYK56185.1 MAG: chemotaxis protein CheC [Fimbriimonadaceae bacterium]
MAIGLGLLETSAVKEMANVGLGHATTSLADLTGRPFNMDIPEVFTLDGTDTSKLGDDPDAVAMATYVPFGGEITGTTAFIFPWESSCALWEMLLGQSPASPAEIDEFYASTALEIGNILCGSFLRAISDMTQVELHAEPPLVSVETLGAISSSMLAQAESECLTALAIETSLFSTDVPLVKGTFLCFPSQSGLAVIMRRLGIPEAA